MRIALLFDPAIIREPFHVENLWTSHRGLTGSEVAFWQYARHLVARGHEVVALTKTDFGSVPGGFKLWEGVKVAPYYRWTESDAFVVGLDARKPHWDAAISWISADPLRCVPHRSETGHVTLRVLNHQCRGFGASKPGWQPHVDLLCPLSHAHAHELRKEDGGYPQANYRVMSNGVDPERFVYEPWSKVPGRVIWASSHDRGLHHLLMMWESVHKQVPEAELHVFYDLYALEYQAREWANVPDTELQMLGARAAQIQSGLHQPGILVHGSVSRAHIEHEMRKATVMAYPLDVPAFTETFGVAVLEACASGTVPVLCLGDAFDELWGSCSMGVPSPLTPERLKDFENYLVLALRNSFARNLVAERARQHALQYDWKLLAAKLERCLETRGKEGLEEVHW